MDRRSLLKSAIVAGSIPVVGACEQSRVTAGDSAARVRSPGKAQSVFPSLFVAHGSPWLVDDHVWMSELRGWASRLQRPEAILAISAHWVDKPVTLSATRTVPLVYDFHGFSRKYYELSYPAPGAPEMASRLERLLSPEWKVAREPNRGLDHGTYIPLLAMYPDAEIPVLQMSIPGMDATSLVALGRALAPLRSEGVLVMGSGFLTHNMRAIDLRPGAVVPRWASEFDAWAAEALMRKDVDSLVSYLEKAPGVAQALPTQEHFVPVLIALGASLDSGGKVAFPIDGFTYGSFTKRSVQFG